MLKMMEVTLALILLIYSIIDIKKREISIVLLAIGFLSGIACGIITQNLQITNVVCCLICIGLFLIFQIIFRNQIGIGDGIVIGMMFIYLDLITAIFSIFIAFMILMFYAGFHLLIKKKSRKYEIPFIPFLFVGYVITLILSYGGK